MGKILTEVLEVIGYNSLIDESDLTDCLRMEAIKWTCFIDEEGCRKAINVKIEKNFFINNT